MKRIVRLTLEVELEEDVYTDDISVAEVSDQLLTKIEDLVAKEGFSIFDQTWEEV